MDSVRRIYQLDLQRPEDVRAARKLSGLAATELGFGELASLVELLASEVLTNVHRHCLRKDCTLQFVCPDTTTLRVEVLDHSLELPCRCAATPNSEGGRGLTTLDLAHCWGSVVHPNRARKCVFFECALDVD